MIVADRLQVETALLWRKLSGRKARARAAAGDQFAAAMAALGPGDTAMDLGANAGVFTAHLAATGADVIAFEPDPHAFAQLREAAGHLPNVTLIKAAAGAEAGTVTLRRHRDFDAAPDRRSTSSSIVAGKRHLADDGIAVEVRDFADYLGGIEGRVAFVKIDIEGAEVALLARLIDTGAIDRIFVETHERALPKLAARTRALKRRAAALERPAINWDWQ